MTRRSGVLAKQGKNLVNKHFEDTLTALWNKNPILRPSGLVPPNCFEWDKSNLRYVNTTTQAMFLGYTVGISDSRQHASGHFIIAHTDEEGRPVFAERPYVHSAYAIARGELKRLSRRKRGTKFILYNSIQIEKALPELPKRFKASYEIDTGCVDDEGISIFIGDTVRHYAGSTGTVDGDLSCNFFVRSSAEGSTDADMFEFRSGNGWTITSSVRVVENANSH